MAKLRPMISMELDDEAKIDAMPIEAAKPDYPYGLRICLTDKELDKLGVDCAEAVVGGMVHMFALARITAVSMDERAGEKCCRVELQIEDLAVESEDEENEEHDAAEDNRPRRRKRSVLYAGDEE